MLKYAVFCALFAILNYALGNVYRLNARYLPEFVMQRLNSLKWHHNIDLLYVPPVLTEAALTLFGLFAVLAVLCVVLEALGLGPVKKPSEAALQTAGKRPI